MESKYKWNHRNIQVNECQQVSLFDESGGIKSFSEMKMQEVRTNTTRERP